MLTKRVRYVCKMKNEESTIQYTKKSQEASQRFSD